MFIYEFTSTNSDLKPWKKVNLYPLTKSTASALLLVPVRIKSYQSSEIFILISEEDRPRFPLDAPSKSNLINPGGTGFHLLIPLTIFPLDPSKGGIKPIVTAKYTP